MKQSSRNPQTLTPPISTSHLTGDLMSLGDGKMSGTSYPPVVLGRPEERWRRGRRRRSRLRCGQQHHQHRPCCRHLIESSPADRPKKLRERDDQNRREVLSTEILEKSYLWAEQGPEIEDLRCPAACGVGFPLSSPSGSPRP